MGIEAGAEMTTFEMRFIALRCKDTIAPTGTIAQGVGAKQINAHGEVYETKYGLTTSQRVYGTVEENVKGRGPCYLRTEGISAEQDESLLKAYLNMAPGQTLKWVESGIRNITAFMGVFYPVYFLAVAVAKGSVTGVAFYNLVLFLIYAVEIIIGNVLLPMVRVYMIIVS